MKELGGSFYERALTLEIGPPFAASDECRTRKTTRLMTSGLTVDYVTGIFYMPAP